MSFTDNSYNSYYGGGNWGGGNWGGGNWGGGANWGGNWYGNNNNFVGPGWSGANWGDWYRGGSAANFWTGYGAGALTTGLSALAQPAYAYSSLGAYPAAWSAPVYGSWGLDSMASDWMYSGYDNPYTQPATQTVVVQQPVAVPVAADGGAAAAPAAPVQPVVAFDYSKPIDVAAEPPEPTAAESAQKVFESARDSFKAGDYGRALSLADQALAMLPDDPALHEFRGLALFALKRYDEAAAVDYAVLSAGPGWNWATLVSLYPSVDRYTEHIRALEAYAGQHTNSAAPQFLLAYYYLVQGDKKSAALQFSRVAKLQPEDKLSAQLAGALDPTRATTSGGTQQLAASGTPPPVTPSLGTPTTVPDSSAGAAESPPPPPPPALEGTWTAKPDPKVSITLVLQPAGTFSWAVTEGGRTQTIQGQAGYQDNVLVLGQEQGPPLTGKVALRPGNTSFTFKPPGAPDSAPGLTFTKEAG